MNDRLRNNLEQRRDELIEEFRKCAPSEADELQDVLTLLWRYAEPPPNPRIPITSFKWADKKYDKKPGLVMADILREGGGRMKREDIANEAVAGGWRIGGKSPYYDILAAIDYALGKLGRGKITLREVDGETVEFIEQ